MGWRSLIALAAFLIGGGAALYIGLPWGLAAFAAGVVVMFVFHEYAVPLVKRDDAS